MESIINALNGNPHFPTPQPTVAQLQAALSDLQTKAAAVKAGNYTVKPARDLAKSTLYSLIAQASTYCLYTATSTSDSVEEAVMKIKSANLIVAEPGENVGPLPAVGNVRGKSLSQAVEFEYDSVRGAYMYLIMTTMGLPSENSVWTETITPRVKHTFQNIPVGQVVTCRVFALGASGKGQGSDFCSVVAGL